MSNAVSPITESKKTQSEVRREGFRDNTAKLFKSLNKAWAIPPKMLVADWADSYRYLSPESSAEAGRWRTSRAEYQREMMNAVSDPKVRKVVLHTSAQCGKALDINTPIPTPNGWTTMEHLKKGDVVYDENGMPCRVTFATDIMYGHKCYEVAFSDGARIIADAEHNWYVESDLPISFERSKRNALTKGVYTGVLTTEELAGSYKYGNRNHRNRYAIPVAKALQADEKSLPIDAYVLGAWLGDGNSCSAQMTVNNNELEIIQQLKARTSGIVVRGKDGASVKNVMLEPLRLCFNTMHKKLTDLGVLNNKHIPAEYLRASYSQRMDLLRGIMDTDGSVSKHGRCEITLKSQKLINDVSELLHTLGIKHTLAEKIAKCPTSRGMYECKVYRISFTVYSETRLFYVEHKQERIKSREGCRTTETERRRIVGITEVESRPVKCIGVDSEKHLYLAGREMIPTHNSEVLNNILGYYMDYDPAPIMLLQPTEAVMESYSKDRIAPMIRDTPVLKDKIVESKSRESGNTISYKKFVGGYLVMIGANTPSQLASRPIRILLADEVDRYPVSAGAEGDPLKLAEIRQTTFWNAKTVISSTPTIKGASKIDAEYEMSSQEELNIACPHCGQYQPLKWAHLKFTHTKDKEDGTNGNVFELHGYECKFCGALDNEIRWKKQPIKWVAKNPSVKKIRGFHLNALISPWKTWESIVDEFLTAKKEGREALKVFVNTRLGESWEEEGEVDFNDLLSKRRQYYNCLIPESVVALTCGVDVQDNRLEYEIVGWSVGKVSWGIKYGIILGDPARSETWDELSKVIFADYERADGQPMQIMSTCVDSGGHKTEQVYEYCRANFVRNVYAIKGVGGSGVPFVKLPKNTNDAGVFLFNIGVDVGKDTLFSRLKISYETEAGFCHFPIESDRGYDEEYFKGLTAEHKVTKYTKGQARIIWEKRSDRARNEPLDLRNYATAALEIKCLGLVYDLLEHLDQYYKANPVELVAKNKPSTQVQERKTVVRTAEETPRRTKKHNGGIQW